MYNYFAEPGSCEEGTVRLVDGVIEQEGRVEVCSNGVWGSICDQNWDKTDAHIVCQQMGYPELGKHMQLFVVSNDYFYLTKIILSLPLGATNIILLCIPSLFWYS